MKNKEIVLLLREVCNGLQAIYMQMSSSLPEDFPREVIKFYQYTEEALNAQREWRKEHPHGLLPDDLINGELKELQTEPGEYIILNPFRDYLNRLEDAISSYEENS